MNNGQIFVGVDVLRTDRAANGILSAQLGDAVTGDPEEASVQWWQHIGFASRPARAVRGQQGPQVTFLGLSQGSVAFASRDARAAKFYGEIEDGETVVYASTGEAKVLLKQDGSVSVFTTEDNTSAGNAIMMSVGPDGFKVITPWGCLSLTKDGFQVNVQDGSVGKSNLSMDKSSGDVTVVSATGTIWNRAATVMLGAAPTPANKAAYGLGGLATVGSNSVFVSA